MWYKFTFPFKPIIGASDDEQRFVKSDDAVRLGSAFNEIYDAAPKPCRAGLFLEYRGAMPTADVLYLYSEESDFDALVERFGGKFSEQPPTVGSVRQIGGDSTIFSSV
jgi:hypothetical protein